MEAYQQRDYAIERYKAQVGEETYKGIKENSKNKNELLKELKEAHQRRKDAEAKAEEQPTPEEQENNKQKDDLARKKKKTDEDYNLTPAEKARAKKYNEYAKEQMQRKEIEQGNVERSGGFGQKGWPYPRDGHNGDDWTIKDKDGKDITQDHPLMSVINGKVLGIGEGKKLGNFIIIEAPDGSMIEYGHLSKVTIKNGQEIKAGDIIGLAGNTGKSTGAHVHIAKRLPKNTPKNKLPDNYKITGKGNIYVPPPNYKEFVEWYNNRRGANNADE